ncbi:hypothetical protein QTP70_000482 [Hemibagrus guttatus]|uniref:Uncharacterized protein n=1 Tax=Hemibagrus guttatus TaxID=175788 RepID=A0AAE0UWV6_9TELE|nr:hypothetical protein QTP70_000482 [Hemibagrus guttatus]
MCFATIRENYDQQRGSGRNLNSTQISSLIVRYCKILFGRDLVWFASYLDGAHTRYHSFCSDLIMSGGHFILDDSSSAETQSQQN